MTTRSDALERPADPVAEPRHPRGLVTLANLELWERFSFYGLEVLLAYYIYYSVTDGGLGLPTSFALGVVGMYGGGAYMLIPLGAWIADRLVPARIVVAVSGCIIMAGHLTLALFTSTTGLMFGLIFVAVGTGGLLPNAVAMMGKLYSDKPRLRDSGFALYYTGVMIGALAGPVVTGFLHTSIGFHVAFSAAAVGMFIGLIIYFTRWKTLPAEAASVPNPMSAAGKLKAAAFLAAALILLIVLVMTHVITADNGNFMVLLAIVLISCAYFSILLRSDKVTQPEKRSVIAYIPLYALAILFWALILQLFTTFAVYADTRVNLSIFGLDMPASYISIFEVIAGIIAGPIIARRWKRLGASQPDIVRKLCLGLGIIALCYAIFAVLGVFYADVMVPLLPVILATVILGVGEVTFAPLTYSIPTHIAPDSYYAELAATVGLGTGAGASLAGFIGDVYSSDHEPLFFGTITVVILVIMLLLHANRRWFLERIEFS